MSSWGVHKKRDTKRIALTNASPMHTKYFIPVTQNSSVICAIALDEDPYIDEWIQYHLKVGFAHIYIYDNSEKNTLYNKTNEHVTIIHFPGKKRHLEAYDIFVTQYKKYHKWAAFIDCDEFIVLKQHKSIADFLNSYNECEAIGLNWIMFGTSHETIYKNEPVTKRFTKCADHVNKHIKCIVQIDKIDRYISSHYPQLLKGHIYDTMKTIITGAPFHKGKADVACIHHYYTKSEEEFYKKILRGTSDEHPTRSLSELDGVHLRNNDVINTDAWDRYRS